MQANILTVVKTGELCLEGFSAFSMMFITIACGTLSGFHATQSPMMAKCIENEKQARAVFYVVVILSITTGDTAFRSVRLSIADSFSISQKKLVSRFMLSALVLVGGILLSLFNLTTIWSYFG